MIENFIFQAALPRVLFGRGTVQATAREAALQGISRPFIICTGSGIGLARRIAGTLPEESEVLQLEHPGIAAEDFERLRSHAGASSADGFIAIGGGTAIGMAKALAANAGLRYVAVVTTYSGSEMAPNWNYGDGKDARRGSARAALASTAIYDPDLTLGLPAVLSGQSGMNAMAHAAESLYGADRSPVIETLAEAAITELASSLPRVVAKPDDIEARTHALYGAWLAAAFRAEVGLEHAIAQNVRKRFGLSHAGTHAVVLPYAIAFNRNAAPWAMKRMERALGTADAAQGLYEMNVRMGLPTGLGQLGMKEEDIVPAVDLVASSPIANPRPVSRADLEQVILQAFHGAPPAF